MINENAVNNFMTSLDTTLPIVFHFKNCLRDAKAYKWSSATVVKIFEDLEDCYKRLKDDR